MKRPASALTLIGSLFLLHGAAAAGPAADATPAPAPKRKAATVNSPSVDRHFNRAPEGLTAWGILPWNGIGVGARYMTPLAIDPIFTEGGIRDSFELEFGADVLHYSYGYYGYDYSWTQVLPADRFMWNLWLNDRFVFYPKIELGYAFGWFSGWESNWAGRPSYGGVFVNGAVGAMYKTKNNITLRAEAGYAGLRLGVGWLF